MASRTSGARLSLPAAKAERPPSKASAPMAAARVESAANPNGPSRRRTGVSFIVFVLLRSFIITCSIVYFVSALLTGGAFAAPNESDSLLRGYEKRRGNWFRQIA